jgi:peptide/nickel transport system substrate-binding protein
VNGVEALWLVYTPLLTYARAEGRAGTTLIPGLAEALPAISDGGRTYRFTLRPGLRYSDGREVRASDFEHSIKRVLHLKSGGSAFFEGIAGARRYIALGSAGGDVSGIKTNDDSREIMIRLDRPDGSFSHVLAMTFAGVVPGDTPFRDTTRRPPPGVGPYRITSSIPYRRFVMERNRDFHVPGIPPGYIDKITTRIVRSEARQAQAVIDGRLDAMQDPPPASFLGRIKRRRREQYREHTTASTYYFFLNHRVPPFDDPLVRKAVNYGVNRGALARTFPGGALTPACSFLPPHVPGYDQALDRGQCPWGDPTGRPQVRRARALIRRAGAAGSAVAVWGNNDAPTPSITRAYARMLNAVGLRASVKILDGSVYFQTIGNARTRAQTGFTNWYQDFPHPWNFFHLVDGNLIRRVNNMNFGNVDVPSINRRVEALRTRPRLTADVVRGWAGVNRRVVVGAHTVPYAHRRLTTFVSERMDIDRCSRFHPVYFNDYSSWCLK